MKDINKLIQEHCGMDHSEDEENFKWGFNNAQQDIDDEEEWEMHLKDIEKSKEHKKVAEGELTRGIYKSEDEYDRIDVLQKAINKLRDEAGGVAKMSDEQYAKFKELSAEMSELMRKRYKTEDTLAEHDEDDEDNSRWEPVFPPVQLEPGRCPKCHAKMYEHPNYNDSGKTLMSCGGCTHNYMKEGTSMDVDKMLSDSTNESKDPTRTFKVGDRVTHTDKGDGTVSYVSHEQISVDWDHPAQKLLGSQPFPSSKLGKIKKLKEVKDKGGDVHNFYECPECGHEWDAYGDKTTTTSDCKNCPAIEISPYDYETKEVESVQHRVPMVTESEDKMFVVYVNPTEGKRWKHSAWDTSHGAKNQCRTLIDNGYDDLDIEHEDVPEGTEDGHYFESVKPSVNKVIDKTIQIGEDVDKKKIDQLVEAFVGMAPMTPNMFVGHGTPSKRKMKEGKKKKFKKYTKSKLFGK